MHQRYSDNDGLSSGLKAKDSVKNQDSAEMVEFGSQLDATLNNESEKLEFNKKGFAEITSQTSQQQ